MASPHLSLRLSQAVRRMARRPSRQLAQLKENCSGPIKKKDEQLS
jgi:hypothetical protein